MSNRFDDWLEAGLRELDAAVPVGEPVPFKNAHVGRLRIVRSGSRPLLPFGLAAVAAILVAFIALGLPSSAGPGTASPSSAATAVASAPASAAPTPSAPGDITRTYGGLSFVAPASWTIVAPHIWVLPPGPLLFLSNAPIADPCPTETLGHDCAIPLAQLPTDGILVTFVGSALPSLPNPTPLPVEAPAAGECARIGGEHEYSVLLQGFGVDACLRGPDFDANSEAYRRLVNSIRRVALQPSPSPSDAPAPTSFDVTGAGLFGTAGIWADANSQLLTSTDRGAIWRVVGPWGLSSDVLDASHIWTVTAGPGSTEQDGSSADVLHFVVSRTVDGGHTWTASTVPGSYPETFGQVRFLSPLTGYLLAAGERPSDGVGTALRTTDGGATWHVMSTLTWPGSTFGIAPDGTLWIGANAEAGPVAHPLLLSSRDGGKTWSKAVLPGLEGRTGGADLYVPEPPVFWSPSEGVVEVADSAGPVRLYLSHDGGRTWKLVTQRQTGGEGGATDGGAFLSATDWRLAEPGSSGDLIVRSTDGGLSWTTAATSIDSSAVGIHSLRFWSASEGIAVALDGPASRLLVTPDGGASWTPVAGP